MHARTWRTGALGAALGAALVITGAACSDDDNVDEEIDQIEEQVDTAVDEAEEQLDTIVTEVEEELDEDDGTETTAAG
jgi:hypothetical protein